jgi:palmitoyltransferase
VHRATFFGLFNFGMTCSSGHFALTNVTTIESLNKTTKAWQLAVYIPDREKPPTMGVTGVPYPTVTYPLPLASEKSSTSPAPSDTTGEQPVEPENNHTDLPRHAERDARAKRTFAILRMEPGHSPWDLGAAGNWKDVMGTNMLDWFLPIRRSPLCNHESAISQFKLGKHFDKLMADNGLVLGNETSPSSARRKSRRHSHRSSASRRDAEMQKYSQQPP